jgi:hypothetical protein
MLIRPRKTRKEILEEEVEDCYTILETAKIERDLALCIEDFFSVKEIGEQIQAMQIRIPLLEKLLEKEINPSQDTYVEDFICSIIIS